MNTTSLPKNINNILKKIGWTDNLTISIKSCRYHISKTYGELTPENLQELSKSKNLVVVMSVLKNNCPAICLAFEK